MSSSRLVQLFTHAQCSLCEPAKYVIQRVQKQMPFRYEEVDIKRQGNEVYHALYQYDIPVIHLDGKEVRIHTTSRSVSRHDWWLSVLVTSLPVLQIFRHRISEKQLLAALNGFEKSSENDLKR